MTPFRHACAARARAARARLHGLAPPVWAILLGGLLLSVAVALGLWQSLAKAENAAFERLTGRVEQELLERFRDTTHGLKGARATFQANQHMGMGVSRSQFRAWMAARRIEDDFPGVRGFGLIQPVDRDTLPRFIAAERADEAPDFDVRQLDQLDHETLYVIKLIEPLERNAAALGLDVGSEARRRRAIERAIDSASITITEPIALVQDGRRTPGFLIFVPYYRTATAMTVPELRRSSIAGVLYSPVVARELLGDVTGVSEGMVDVRLSAGPAATAALPENLVFDSAADGTVNGATPGTTAGTSAATPEALPHRKRRSIEIFGSPFTLEFTARAGVGDGAPWQPWAALLAGLLVTGLLARLVQQKTTQQARAEAYAAAVTADLERLALVARRTSDAVVITDALRRITWVNEGFTRITGYTLAEVAGQVPGRFLQCESTDAAELARLSQAVRAGQGFRGELLNRSKSGRLYWNALEIQPLRSPEGQLTGFMAIQADVTERKDNERELSRERTRLAQIIDGTAVGTWEWNIETGVTVFNERWAQIVGCTLAELGPTRIDTWTRLVHPDDLARSGAALEQHFSGAARMYECEARMRHRDGHWVWVLDRGKVFRRDAQGRPQWMAGTHLDITERKAAEAALRASEALLDRTGRMAAVGGWELDVARGSVRWSAQACRIQDLEPGEPLSPEEAIARVSGPAQAVLRQALQDVIASGRPFDLELPLTTARGRSIWVRALGEARQEDGRTTHVVGALQDITRQRALEDALRQRHAQMATIIESLPCALSVFDADLRLILSNRQFRQLLDLPDALFEGEPSFERFARFNAERGEYGPGDVETQVRALVARVSGEVQPHQFERTRPDGRTLEIRGRPMPGGGFVSTALDVTEIKQTQLQLQERSRQAEEASVAKSRFLANMSHEIRTPMNAILGMLRLLRRTDLDPRQQDYAAKTEGAARSLLGLLNDILDFSKVEAGKLSLDPQPFSLERLLADLSVIYAASVGDKPVELMFDVDPAVPDALLGDALRLQQVLINLGGNAIKFTAEGEVVLRIGLAGRRAGNGNDSVRLVFSVRDTGIGIAPENQARIFSGFTQAEGSTTRRYGGTGLGVAISQRIVALMGGDLRLRSALGEGSEFSFEIELPLAPADAAAALAHGTAVSTAGTPLRVLVVDDHPLARQALCAAAQQLGWQADEASDAGTALAAFEAALQAGAGYDAVVVDWMMPGTDGWGLARALHAHTAGRGRPRLVMVTAHGRDGLQARTPQEQALIDGFLVKPVTAGMLAAAVAGAAAVAPATPALAAPAPRPLAGLCLLVAEDNLNNQQVARELLQDEGAEVVLAGNGREAVDTVLRAPARFDLVLMDLQMPVMDGLEAARTLRRRAATDGPPALARLPIVAMTANAMASDRAACLAAGMNDHVGKPFDLAQLVQVILRHTGRAEVDATPAAQAGGPQSAHNIEATAPAGIALQPALARLGGRSAVYLRLLAGFGEELARLPEVLAAHAAAGRVDELARALHTARGSAATLGMTALAAALRQAEAAVQPPGAEIDAGTLVRLAPHLAEGLAAVQRLRDALTPPAAGGPAQAGGALPPPVDPTAVQTRLSRLLALLSDSDMAAMEALEALAQAFQGAEPDWLAGVRAAVEAMDFGAAAQRCRQQLEAMDTVA